MQPLITNNLRIRQGADFNYLMRYGVAPLVYKTITGAAKTAPLRLTVTHGLVPASWPIVIAGVRGMTEINAQGRRPPEPYAAKDYVIATVDDSTHLLVNAINAAAFSAYSGGGTIQYPTPFDLTGYTARMQIRHALDSTDPLLSLTTENSRIVLDATNATIALALNATTTAAITWENAIYDLELVSAGGAVISFMGGKVAVTKEITR